MIIEVIIIVKMKLLLLTFVLLQQSCSLQQQASIMLAPNRTSLHSFSTSVFDPHFRFVFGDDSTEKEFRLIIIRLCSHMCNFSIKRYFSWKIFLNQTVLTIFLFICVNLNVPVKPQKYCLGSKLLHIWTKKHYFEFVCQQSQHKPSSPSSQKPYD